MKRLLLTLLAVVVGLVVHATDYKLVTDVSQLEVGARYLVVFMGGVAGFLFRDQAMSVSIVLLTSYVVTVVVIPVFYYWWFKGKDSYVPNRLLSKVDPMPALLRWDDSWMRKFTKEFLPFYENAKFESGCAAQIGANSLHGWFIWGFIIYGIYFVC